MLRPLNADDQTQVVVWQEDYVAQHIRWWEQAYQTRAVNTPRQVAEKNWQELLEASRDPRQHVQVFGEVPLGIIQGRIRHDPYLGVDIGQLSWIYVDPAGRGLGVADQLVTGLLGWFDDMQVSGREVFVTALNPAAVRLYERNGFQTVDYRMLGPGAKPAC